MVVSLAKESLWNKTIEKPSPPPILYICDLDCSIETIMHLGMNVSKHCENATFQWAKELPGFSCSELIQDAQLYIKVIDTLKLAEFPVMQFKTESMGGYVAENHRAFMQLAPWVFRWINEYKDNRKKNWIQELDERHLNKWTRRQMFAYLTLRGVPFKKTTMMTELKRLVKASKDLPELQKFEPFSGSDMRQMILVLNSFLSAMYATDITGPKARHRLYALAKLYLCFSSRLDSFHMNKTATYQATFSLLGMLRVKDTFDLAPYPICFYEGDGMGEGIVKEIRPILLSGLRKGWTVAGQGTYYRRKTLAYMQEILLSASTLHILQNDKRPVRCNTKVYRWCANVELAMEEKSPFAFSLFKVLITRETIIAIVTTYEQQLYIRVLHVANKETFQDKNGFAYFETSLNPKIEHPIIDREHLRSLTMEYISSGLALPSLRENVYAFILGNGEKKVPGNQLLFSPTTINKTYTSTSHAVTNTSVLL